MIKHYNMNTGKETKVKTSFSPKPQNSVTDKSHYRPEISTIRDKAISLNENGGGRIGLYDIKSPEDKKVMTQEVLRSLSYARNNARDITEIETAKNIMINNIENKKEIDKQNVKEKQAESLIKSIEKNTRKNNTEKTDTETN